MSKFFIKIANHVGAIETLYSHTLEVCDNFLTTESPEYSIKINQSDIEFERIQSIANDGYYNTPDEYLESIAVLRKISDQLIDYNVILIHGVAIALGNEAYLFSGNSGVGKSTHMFRWLQRKSDAVVINGDKPFVILGDLPMVCGSPWAGKEGLYKNTIVPLKSIVFLERSENNVIEKISFSESFAELYQQIYRPDNHVKLIKSLKLLNTLNKKVSFYRYYLNNFKSDAFDIAYHALVNQMDP